MDSLEKKGEKNAAQTLRERVAICESCDILKNKNLREMKSVLVKKLVASCQDAWPQLPALVKWKLAHHHFISEILPAAVQEIESPNEQAKLTGFRMLSSGLSFVPRVGGENGKGPAEFRPLSPTLDAAFQCFIKEVTERMEQGGFLKQEVELSFNIDSAVPDPAQDEKLKALLEPLTTAAED